MERVFTLEEARALVPTLSGLLTQLQAAHRELVAVAPKEASRIASGNGSASTASALAAAEHRYVELIREIDGIGVIVRDPRTGLVDFAATRDDEPIYLCWRLGESDIGHWHPRDTGMAGRQPL